MRLAMLFALLAASAFATPVFAQSADQQLVSATDSPDPATPGGTLTYTVTITNNGPDAAVNGGMNASLDGNLTLQGSIAAPAGFTCASFGNNHSCTNPSFSAGSTAVFTLNATVAASLANFPDTSLSSLFSTSGVTPDPNNGNNSATVTTAVDSPQVDLSVQVTDSPDPVFPDGNITYTVTAANAGPDTATGVDFNVFNNGSLRFVSATVPAGFSCVLPAVNGVPTFTCTTAAFAPGSVQFTVVVQADDAVLGANDGTVSTVFSLNGTGDDTNDGNNAETEDTAYVTPDADLRIAASDSPDPVGPDGDITYAVTVFNDGPDTATGVVLDVPLNNTLRFQSITQPAGFSCSPPAVGAGTSFSCTAASLAGSAAFTLVLRANDEQFGLVDQTIVQAFNVTSAVADPDGSDNSVEVSTQYVAPDADLRLAASDSPDPVAPDGDITYTVTVTNDGPDTATGATLDVPLDGTLRFQSLTAPAGWSCSPPAVGDGTSFACTNASLVSGAVSAFTVVLRANDEQFGLVDQTIQQAFTVTSGVSDPDPGDNQVVVQTTYAAPDADLAVSASGTPGSVAPGDTLTYTYTLQNTGPDAASGVQLTASLDASVSFQSLAAPAGYSCTTPAVGASGTITCTRASLSPAPADTFTLTTQVAPSLSGSGTLTFTLQASASGSADADPADDTAQVLTPYATPSADLSLTKTTSDTLVSSGDTVSYTLVLSNAGPDAASNVSLVDTLPASLNFAAITAPAGFSCVTPAVGSTGTVTCTAATLAASADATFVLQSTVAANASGTLVNQASAGSDTGDADPADNAAGAPGVVVMGTADLAVSKTTAATTTSPGATLSYTVTLTNNGPATATTVALTDVLPAALRFTSISAPAGFTCTTPAVGANGTVTCSAASLAAGATATFTLVATVAPGSSGTITNTASATAANDDPDPGNNSATSAPLPVQSEADLRLTKTLTSGATAPTGSSVDYVIGVTNDGPADATGVTVTDVLPAGLAFVSATPSQGTCTGTATVTCSLGSLLAGATATVNLRATLVATGGSVVNSASVAATSPDADATDNAASAGPLTVQAPAPGRPAIVPAGSWFAWTLLAVGLLLVAGRGGPRR